MTMIIVDGPNKSGKTTLINNTVKELLALSIDTKVRHWGPLEIDDREYSEPLEQESQFSGVVIWDRSWCSEHVYNQLLNRQHRRSYNDPWLLEFLHRRSIVGNGKCFVIAPKSGMNEKLLDESDAIYSDNHLQELRLFIDYAIRFKWHGLVNDYTPETLARNTSRLVAAATAGTNRTGQRQLVGNNPNVLIISSKHLDDPYPGDWLPASSQRIMVLARLFGDAGLCATWADVEAVNMLMLSKYKNVLCVGKRAYDKVKSVYQSKSVSLVYIPLAAEAFGTETQVQVTNHLLWDQSVQTFKQLLEIDWKAIQYL